MPDERQRRRFEAQVRAADEQSALDESRLSAHSTKSPRPGDLYVFPIEFPLALQWAIIESHPRDSCLLFIVPADDAPWVGTTDLRTNRGVPSARLTLRCGCGLWLHEETFSSGLRVALLDEQDQQRAQQLLARLVRGMLNGSLSQVETDADPDYADWIAQVLMAVEQLRSSMESLSDQEGTVGSQSRVILLNQFHRGWPMSLAHQPDLASEFALVAASKGLLGQVVEQLAAPLADPPLQYRVEADQEGELYVLAEPEGIRLIYLPTGNESPPLLEFPAEGEPSEIQWTVSPRGTLYLGFPKLPWREGRAEFGQVGGVSWVVSQSEDRDGA